ncbi:thioredoxin family protein [Olivibacter ginsenosidimutans]
MKISLASTLIYVAMLLSPIRSKAADGVQFFEGSWKALLQLAKEQNKPIFVDVYTDWCAPCKRMDQEVLPLPAVGKAYNESFINYKLNAEKGEGPQLAKQYEVHAYPTYLYLSPTGVLLARVVDYQEPDRFIAYAHEALKKNDQQVLAHMDKQFQEGNRDISFLRDYIVQKKDVGLDNSTAFDAYISAQPGAERNKPANLDFIINNLNKANGAAFNQIIQAYPSTDQVNQKKWAPKLFSLLYDAFGTAMKENQMQKIPLIFKQMKMLQQQLNPKQLDGINRYQLLYAQKIKDVDLTKEVGYAYVAERMNISQDSMDNEDRRRYAELMKPYRNGKRDSTEISAEDKVFLQKIYTNDVSVHLYETSNAFAMVLPANDPALKDALQWAERLVILLPHKPNIIQLRDRIKQKITGKAL